MQDENKTTAQLISELTELRRRNAELEAREAGHKRAKEALRESEEKYRIIFNNEIYAICIFDLKTLQLLDVNEAYTRLYGYSRAELIFGMTIHDITAERQVSDAATAQAIREGTIFIPLRYHRKKDGTVFPVEIVGGPYVWQGRNVMFALAHDITDRKQTEEALHDSRAFLNNVIEHSPNALWISDEHGTLLRMNQACRDNLHLRDDEVVGKYNLFQDNLLEAQGFMPLVKDVFEKGITARFITSYNTAAVKNLELERTATVILDVNISPIRDAQGKITNAIIQHIDITERKRMETALHERERYLNTILQTTQDGFGVFTADGKITEVNDAICRMLGYNRSELLSKPITDIIAEENPDITASRISRILAGEAEIFESRHRRKDGSTVAVEISLNYSHIGNGQFFCFTRDITERKQAEEALRRVSGQLTGVIESSRDIIAMMDPQYRYILFNSAFHDEFRHIFGHDLKPGDSMPQALAHLSNDLADALQYWNRALGGEDFIVSQQFGDAQLARNWYELHFSPVRDNAGQVVGAVHIVRDITERKRAEEAQAKLEDQNRQLQKAESLGRMAGAIAHHFNNQLQAVMGYLELALMNRPLLPETMVKQLSQSMKSAQKAATVSRQMLTYLGQTSGKLEVLYLSEACNHGLSLLRAAIPKNAVLRTDLPSPGPVVKADENQIQQLLNNLVTNAWEAIGDKQGAIHLSVKTVSPAGIPTAHRFPLNWQAQDKAYACLTVTDTGCGIESHGIEKIFDPFFSSKFTGRGLGLSVVLGIVRVHKGVITVESEPGRGSAFRVFFPLVMPEISLPAAQNVPVPERNLSGTILLVEDEESVRLMVMQMLASLGFTILAAKDGVEAVEIFKQHKDDIQCVICDLIMPRMDGWETLTALRQIAPDVPVVLSSGYDEARVMAGNHPERPQAFLGKPFQIAALKDALTGAIGKMRD